MAVTIPRGARLPPPGARAADALLAGLLLAFLAVAVPTPVVTDPAGVVGTPHMTLGGHWESTWWAWTVQLALVVPLVWRRRAPRVVLAVVSAVAFVQWLAGPALYGDLALLVAIYTVASRDSGARAYALIASVAVAAALLGAERWAGDSTLATVLSLAATLLVVPAAAGVAVRARRDALRADRENAARAERARIAREMHDVVAHNVSVMVALADGARLTAGSDPARADAAVAQVAATGREALGEMRGMLGLLREEGDDAALRPQPGIGDLDSLVAPVRAAGIDVALDVAPGHLGGGSGLVVHRVVQEALTNVLKHGSEVRRIDVSVLEDRDALTVIVCNDGARARGVGAGFGLRGMAERVAAHGGTLEAGPLAGGGWQVRAALSTQDGRA